LMMNFLEWNFQNVGTLKFDTAANAGLS
jgi:hypothetical protein